MNITLIAVGKRMPDWVETAYQDYAKRLPKQFCLNLIELPLSKRTKNADIPKLIAKEGQAMLEAIPPGSLVIALEVTGKTWDTPTLAEHLRQWRDQSRDITLLIGGPEGLAPAALASAELKWSLSALTLPHPLVRVVVAEQLYRAYSIITGHPYHR